VDFYVLYQNPKSPENNNSPKTSEKRVKQQKYTAYRNMNKKED